MKTDDEICDWLVEHGADLSDATISEANLQSNIADYGARALAPHERRMAINMRARLEEQLKNRPR